MAVVPFEGLLLAASVKLGLSSNTNMHAEAPHLDIIFHPKFTIYFLNRVLI